MTQDGEEPNGIRRRTLLVSGGVIGASMAVAGAAFSPTAPQALATAEPGHPDLKLRKFADKLRIPPVLRPNSDGELTVHMRTTRVRIHADLPPTTMWTYEGHFPGPTIEVERGQRLRVAWTNDLTGTIPLIAVEIPDEVPGRPPGVPPTNYPGRDGAKPLEAVAKLRPWNAVHVHGAHTGGGQDGWPENGIAQGETQLSEYGNDQPSTTLWYHDHAMHLTRFTIMSGLTGMYLIRDEEERKLRLPKGRYEVPLILCDRNLETDGTGNLTSTLMHKMSLARTEPARIMVPFAGPYTLVNGVIWPYFDVEPRWYRFRMLNASNARVFRLVVLDEENKVVPGALKVIGSDGGLLGAPVAMDEPMILSGAERVDVLVDFSAFRGRKLRLVNTRPGTTPGQPDPINGVVEPDVMQFRVSDRPVRDDFKLPAVVAPSFNRLTRADLPPNLTKRLVVLTSPGAPGDPEMWEMEEVDAAKVKVPSDGVIQIEDADGRVRTYRRIAGTYDDKVGYVIPRGAWEEWTFLNLGGPPHPMHVHLVRFQVLNRDTFDISGFDWNIRGTTKPVKFLRAADVEAHETGWKDVVRVASGLDRIGERVTVAGRFGDSTGRYVYHCHLLEHEHGMMRPFLVLPPEVLALNGHPHGGGHHH